MSKNLYIIKYYIKYFLLIIVGLSLFFIAIDFMQNGKEIPTSVNLQILYFYYKFLYATSILFPISLIFGAILTLTKLLKDNSLIALYSIGYSDKDVLTPIFTSSLIITIIFILLYTTDFANSKRLSEDIIEGNPINKNSQNLFFKYEIQEDGEVKSYYIFFAKLFPIQNLAEGIRLFNLDNDGKLSEVIQAKYAYYEGTKWVIYSAKFLENRKHMTLNSKAIKIIDKEKFFVLNGFKPKILNKIYESEINFNLTELIDAIKLMRSQGFNIEKLKISFYKIVVYPLFASLLIVIIFKYMPISSRFANINLFVFFAVISSLLIWGSLFALLKLSFTGNLISEYAVVLPVLILALIALWTFQV